MHLSEQFTALLKGVQGGHSHWVVVAVRSEVQLFIERGSNNIFDVWVNCQVFTLEVPSERLPRQNARWMNRWNFVFQELNETLTHDF